MTYSICIDDDVHSLATNSGWHAFKNWVDSMGTLANEELLQFAHYGLSQNASRLESDLMIAVTQHPIHSEALQAIVDRLRKLLSKRDVDSMTVYITDGLGSSDGEPDDGECEHCNF